MSTFLRAARAEAQSRQDPYPESWMRELYSRFVEALDPQKPQKTLYIGVIDNDFDAQQESWWTKLPDSNQSTREAITWLIQQGIPAKAFQRLPDPPNDIINGVVKIVVDMTMLPPPKEPASGIGLGKH